MANTSPGKIQYGAELYKDGTLVGWLKNLAGLGREAVSEGKIATHDLTSLEFAEGGLIDEGTLTGVVVWDPSDTEHIELRTDVSNLCAWVVKLTQFATNNNCAFDGKLMSFGDIEFDTEGDVVEASFSIRVSGEKTWTTV